MVNYIVRGTIEIDQIPCEVRRTKKYQVYCDRWHQYEMNISV